jgi:hypothetical protein
VIRDVIANRSGTQSALTSLEARVLLVDDVDAALAANQAVIAMTGLKRFKRILDLHFTGPQFCTVCAVLFKQSKARNGARSFRLAGRYPFEPCLSTLGRAFALKD